MGITTVLGPVHNGGGKPLTATEPKVVAFFSLTSQPVDYNVNATVSLPPWAGPSPSLLTKGWVAHL